MTGFRVGDRLEIIAHTAAQLKELALDETTMFGIARVTQVWARR